MGNIGASKLRASNYIVWYQRYASGGEPTTKAEHHRAFTCYGAARNQAIHLGANLSRLVDGKFGPLVLDGAAVLRERVKKGVQNAEV